MSTNAGTIALALRLSKRLRMPELANETLAQVSQDLAPKRYADESAGEIETRFGTVDIGPDGLAITAHGAQLWAWSHRPMAAWPCSTLEDLDGISVVFDTNGLLDMDLDPARDPETDWTDASELSAWSADCLRTAGLSPDHPCHFVCVGQFD